MVTHLGRYRKYLSTSRELTTYGGLFVFSGEMLLEKFVLFEFFSTCSTFKQSTMCPFHVTFEIPVGHTSNVTTFVRTLECFLSTVCRHMAVEMKLCTVTFMTYGTNV